MIKPHSFAWTPEAIARFWSLYESSEGMDLWHFSRQRGAALLRHVAGKIDIQEPVLDLGSGSGHLLKLLLGKNLKCSAADVSSRGVEITAARFAAHPGFLGARHMESNGKIPFDDASMGSVFMLETIEHLLPQTLAALLSEIPRVLSKNGLLVITAPWCEDLEAGSVSCASCGCRFHVTQHQRSFDEADVTALVEGAGFKVISCKAELLLPDLSVWLKAQVTPARKKIACPECALPCKSPNRSLFTRGESLVSELKHLVSIARKK